MDGVAYSISTLSSEEKKGVIRLPKPAMAAIEVTDSANLVKWESYSANVAELDSIRIYRSFSATPFVLITTIPKADLASSANLYVDRITNFGEHVRYYVQTVVNNVLDLKQVSDESDTLETYCYLPVPETFQVSKGAYFDSIKVNWNWTNSTYGNQVDSFILNRYKAGVLDTTYTVAKTTTVKYDTASLVRGVNYVYSLKSKKNNTLPYLPVISTDSITGTGYAKFPPPDTLIASTNSYSITLRWGYKEGTAGLASNIQYLVVRDTTQSNTWQGNIMDTVVRGQDTFYVDDYELIHGSVRWYKVAAFNDISKEKVLSKPVRGYSILDSVEFIRYDQGVDDDTIIVKWAKVSTHKAYFVEWSTSGSLDANTGRFVSPIDSIGIFSNFTYTSDSAIIRILQDSLKGRKIYVRVWTKNDFGRSDGSQTIGWTKLPAPKLIKVTDGDVKDALSLKIKRSTEAAKDNAMTYQFSYTRNKNELFANGYQEIALNSATFNADTLLDTIFVNSNYAGYVYYVGFRASNDLYNTTSEMIVDSGYSKIPIVSLSTVTPALYAHISLSWNKKDIGGDTLKYLLCRAKGNATTFDTIDTIYDGTSATVITYRDSNVIVAEPYKYYVYTYAPNRFGVLYSDSSYHVTNYARVGYVDSLRQVANSYKYDTISLVWKAIEEVDTYIVYRSNDANVSNRIPLDTVEIISAIGNLFGY